MSLQNDLAALYQDVIVDHNRRPRNQHPLPGATHHAEGDNPLCGDRVGVDLVLRDGTLEDIAFQGVGCAISQASASLMTEAVKGKSVAEARELGQQFRALVTQEPSADPARLGKLVAFAGVREYPMRVKCATLAWHTLFAALDASVEPASTE